jgi:hypothetical protein
MGITPSKKENPVQQVASGPKKVSFHTQAYAL